MVSASQWIPSHCDMVIVYVSQVDLGLGWSQWSKQTRLPPEVLPIIFFTPRPIRSTYIFKGASHSRLKGVASEASEGFEVHGSRTHAMRNHGMAWHGMAWHGMAWQPSHISAHACCPVLSRSLDKQYKLIVMTLWNNLVLPPLREYLYSCHCKLQNGPQRQHYTEWLLYPLDHLPSSHRLLSHVTRAHRHRFQ